MSSVEISLDLFGMKISGPNFRRERETNRMLFKEYSRNTEQKQFYIGVSAN